MAAPATGAVEAFPGRWDLRFEALYGGRDRRHRDAGWLTSLLIRPND
jgi:hypothetical protein